MEVIETKDIEEIKKVLFHPEIRECISNDKYPDVVDIPVGGKYKYIAGYIGDDIIGVMVYHKFKDGLKVHIQVLPEYRKEHSKEFARIVAGETKNAIIYSEVPVCYPNVIRFAEWFGFIETGRIKDGYTKNGESCDVVSYRMENGNII